jgi:hypothetical protein
MFKVLFHAKCQMVLICFGNAVVTASVHPDACFLGLWTGLTSLLEDFYGF